MSILPMQKYHFKSSSGIKVQDQFDLSLVVAEILKGENGQVYSFVSGTFLQRNTPLVTNLREMV